MYIHNASFIIDPARGEEFIDWMLPLARKVADPAVSRLSVMRQAGGEVAGEAQALSVAFQTEFHTVEEAEEWVRKRLNPLVAAFERRFAPGAMVFTSIFETIPLT